MLSSTFSNHTQAANKLPVIVALECELVRGTEAEILGELIPRVRQHSIALDLSQVDRIDAAGIATLITLHCTSVEAGTHFSVIDPSSHVLELLRLVGLESILINDRALTESYSENEPQLEEIYSAA